MHMLPPRPPRPGSLPHLWPRAHSKTETSRPVTEQPPHPHLAASTARLDENRGGGATRLGPYVRRSLWGNPGKQGHKGKFRTLASQPWQRANTASLEAGERTASRQRPARPSACHLSAAPQPAPAPVTTTLLSNSTSLTFSESSQKWELAIFVLLWPAYLGYHNVPRFHPCRIQQFPFFFFEAE